MKRDHKFEVLVQRYVDAQITDSEVLQLNQRLRGDAEARQRFIELMNLDSALVAAAVDSNLDMDNVPVPPSVVCELREPQRSGHTAPKIQWALDSSS